ncbi:endo-1,4-beta-xylanase [Thermostaphylospora chromogena]|uniref:endo-1,4-beta-xylanase n=1 Tax=Thermostaphylospora chromogena TaxID=35622 RepID=UPI001F624FD3|nr:endo-1,4-beta-xylanase [Thermostaphylospora chromogena]
MAVLGLVSAFLSPASPASASAPLRVHAEARGKFIGAALATGPLSGESQYRTIAGREFNQITAENVMKWDTVQPSEGNFNFSGADQIMQFAEENDQEVHGHTLVWHSQTPGWVQGLSRDRMLQAMRTHISRLVGRYADNPRLVSWDVVNEAFNEDGTMRQSFWYNTIGESYIAEAFHAARQADPDARLCINDYNVEGINAKSNGMYDLVRRLLSQGVPIDCVGFQGHLAIQYGFPNTLQQNIERFAALGLEVRITELDIRMQMPRDSYKDSTQASYYRQVVEACLAVSACSGVTIWGFTDRHSWVPDTFPGEGAALIYDENYQPKQAYDAVHDALARPGDGNEDDTTPPTAPGQPSVSDVTSSSARLTWSASTDSGGSGLAGYNVYREQGDNDTLLGQSTTTSITLTGLSPDTEYEVYVRARDGAGNLSDPSPSVTFTTEEGPPAGEGGCSVTPTVQNEWNNGYVMQPVTVTNTGDAPITGWTVTFTLPSGHSIVGSWNAEVGNGQATNAAYNGSLAPGQSTTFGFQVSRPDGDTATAGDFTCTAN